MLRSESWTLAQEMPGTTILELRVWIGTLKSVNVAPAKYWPGGRHGWPHFLYVA